ncbi:hypothetical protein [Xanthomonas arboricola]|uniref:hypothetical protein n=1 Tax=Xanthomonas arboricola TaxID=56448 RepID=UPI003CCF395F
MTGDANFRSVPAALRLLARIVQGMLGQRDCISSLRIVAIEHHRAVGLHGITINFFGAPMRNDDVSTPYALINGSLITGPAIIDMLQNFIRRAANI